MLGPDYIVDVGESPKDYDTITVERNQIKEILCDEKKRFFTVAGVDHYHGTKPFYVGEIVTCIKEPENPIDEFAIRVETEQEGKCGYVAVTEYMMAPGTVSNFELFDLPDQFQATVVETAGFIVCCVIEDKIEGIKDMKDNKPEFSVKLDEIMFSVTIRDYHFRKDFPDEDWVNMDLILSGDYVNYAVLNDEMMTSSEIKALQMNMEALLNKTPIKNKTWGCIEADLKFDFYPDANAPYMDIEVNLRTKDNTSYTENYIKVSLFKEELIAFNEYLKQLEK